MQTQQTRRAARNASTIMLPVCFFGILILACASLPVPRATATPTGQIGAVEQGPTASAAERKSWQVWQGTILSQTSREYKSNGSTVNTCTTDWSTDMAFTVDPAGDISGLGVASLTAGPRCSPLARSGNTSYMTISAHGRKDSSAVHLALGVVQINPMPSADFGGYGLLISTAACPPVEQNLAIPLTSPSAAASTLDLSATLTGCGGSKDDLMSNQSQVSFHVTGTCSDNPFSPSDPNADICK